MIYNGNKRMRGANSFNILRHKNIPQQFPIRDTPYYGRRKFSDGVELWNIVPGYEHPDDGIQ